MKLQPEQREMIAIFDWIRWNKLDKFIWHTANERRCSVQHGSILKRMGVKAGVVDISIARARNGYHGAFIEVKVGKNSPTETQIEFMKTMNEEGYFTKTVWGAEAAIHAIMEYLYYQGTPSSSS